MYITNTNNIGMATLLQQNKATCMKTLINGSNNTNTGNNVNNTSIVVGSLVSGIGTGGSQAGGATPGVVSGATTVGGLGGLGGGSGNLVLSTGQTLVLTNGATGASSIINYQQYQQLLQQQQQQQQQIISSASALGTVVNTATTSGARVLMPHEMVTLPISGIVTTQGHFLVAATASPMVHPIQTNTISAANMSSFQQQFQQQIAAQSANTGTIVVSSAPTSRTTTTIYSQQSATGVPATRYFSQFSNQPQQQQQSTTSISPTATTSTIVSAKATGNRTTHVLINRSNNTIIAGNTTQRLQHAKILNKPPTNIAAATASTTANTVTNAVIANKSQIINNSNSQSPAMQAVKLQQQQLRQNIPTLQHIKQPQLLQPQKIQLVKPIVHSGNSLTLTATKTTTVANIAGSPGGARNITKGALVNGGLKLVPSRNIISSSNSNDSGNNKSGSVTAGSATMVTLAAKTLPTAAVQPQKQLQQQQLQLQKPQQQQLKQQQLQTQQKQQQHLNQNQNQHGQTQEQKPITAHSRTIPATPHQTSTQLVEANKTANQQGTAAPTEITASATNLNSTPAATEVAATTEPEVEPEIDIVINNVVCSFSVRCHLNLRDIALKGLNVEYRRENGMVTMKLRRPYTTASIWSSGRITCTGATSEEQAKIAARRYARCLEKLGFRARFHNFRVVNVLGTCSMPWAIKILNFSERYKKEASYEPELHPGVTYKLRYPKATLKIFSTGSITVTAASVANVQAAIEHIFPLVYEFRKKRSPEEMEQLRIKQQNAQHLIDVNEVEEVLNTNDVAAGSNSNVPTTTTLQRRLISNNATTNNFRQKRRRLDNDSDIEEISLIDAEEIDDPEPRDMDDNFVMYDPDDLIEGPDDEEDL